MIDAKEVKILSDEKEINAALADGFEIHGEPILAEKDIMWYDYTYDVRVEIHKTISAIFLVLYKYNE